MTLSAVAEQTKISQPLLEGLERDEVTRWPTGIFRRAFVRAYAEAIGLQPDDVVREFMMLYPDPTEVVSIGDTLATVASTKRRPPTRLAQIAGAATESVLGFLRRIVGVEAATEEAAPAPALPRAPVPEMFSETEEASRLLETAGLILWSWMPDVKALVPAMSAGYSSRVLAQLPNVSRDADNATAAAFRSEKTCAVPSVDGGAGALAVPVMRGGRCAGVLTVELQDGAEHRASVRAAAAMIATQLGRLMETGAEASRTLRSA